MTDFSAVSYADRYFQWHTQKQVFAAIIMWDDAWHGHTLYLRAPDRSLSFPDPSLLLISTSGRQQATAAVVGSPASSRPLPKGTAGSQLCPDPAPAIEGTWGMDEQMGEFCLSVIYYFPNK